MPFDGVPEITLLTPINGWGNEKLARLEMLLRTDFETTHRHQWDFGEIFSAAACGTAGCALGLAHAAGLLRVRPAGIYFPERWATKEFALPEAVYERLFLPRGDHHGYAAGYRVPYDDVTPLMVADAIRRYMTTGEV